MKVLEKSFPEQPPDSDTRRQNIFSFVPFSTYSKRQWLAAIALYLAYFVAIQISWNAYTAPAVIVPGVGIALAFFLLEGIVLWPALVLALITHYLVSGMPFPLFLFFTLANTLTPLVAAVALKRLGFSNYFRRLRDMLLFFAIIPLASAITPSLGMLSLYVNRLFDPNGPGTTVSFGAWWIGVVTSILLVTPLIVRWGASPHFKRTRLEALELVVAFALFFLVAFTLYWTPYQTIHDVPLTYFLFPPLFWVALRSGPRFLSLMLFLLGLIAATGIFWGMPSELASATPLGLRLFQQQLLLMFIALIFYVIVAIEEERKEALRAVSSQIARLENVLSELEGESKAKSDFLAMLAHELRNPLAPVVSSIELMRVRNQVNDEGLPVLNVMEGSVRVIKRLLDDLLDISRITQNKIALQKESFHIGFVARRAIKNLEKRFEEKRQTILLDLPKAPMMIEADPVRIEQVLTNLLGNASKFTPQGGTISLRILESGGMAEIRIHDSGLGIDPSMIHKIFEPFVQGDRDKGGKEGLGIGLALTQKLVELHGGTVEAKSPGKGKGSEFIARLPLAYSARISNTELQLRDGIEQSAETMRRILIVDDNAASAHAIGALLEHDGYTVQYALTGEEARRRIDPFAPHVVIMDIGLPDISGHDLARIFRRDHAYGGLMIALTGYGLEEDQKKSLASGFNIHLTKPIGMRDLRRTLATI